MINIMIAPPALLFIPFETFEIVIQIEGNVSVYYVFRTFHSLQRFQLIKCN